MGCRSAGFEQKLRARSQEVARRDVIAYTGGREQEGVGEIVGRDLVRATRELAKDLRWAAGQTSRSVPTRSSELGDGLSAGAVTHCSSIGPRVIDIAAR